MWARKKAEAPRTMYTASRSLLHAWAQNMNRTRLNAWCNPKRRVNVEERSNRGGHPHAGREAGAEGDAFPWDDSSSQNRRGIRRGTKLPRAPTQMR